MNLFFSDVILSNCKVGSCAKDLVQSSDELKFNATEIIIGNFTESIEGTNSHQMTVYSIVVIMLIFSFIIASSTLLFMVSSKRIVKRKRELILSKESVGTRNNTKHNTMTFKNISYKLKNGKQILSNISGIVKSGEVAAIMGPSGAGKTTFIEILAMRYMTAGKISGSVTINAKPLNDKMKRNIGYVDQGDNLSISLTVFENLLFSALLRLPQDITMEQKIEQVHKVMKTLQLSHVANTKIGSSGSRGISGGEKRRVSVGMELVNNPDILFLDEPTSGLDAYNAKLLIQCLNQLAWRTGTAVLTTIHQPRSNIFVQFDRLLVIHQGQSVFCGPIQRLHPYLSSIGSPIPPDYNPADYLIDILFDDNFAELSSNEKEKFLASSNINTEKESTEDHVNISQSIDFEGDDMDSEKRNAATLFNNEEYLKSHLNDDLIQEIDEFISSQMTSFEEINIDENKSHLLSKIYLWSWQVLILSSRNTIVLFRNPLLFAFHVGFSIYFALLLGVMYYDLDMRSLSSIQNRLGAFMLMAVFVSFTSLSALPLFWLERPLYVHERSNRFYSTSAYFVSKIFSDILPIRVIPTLILGLVSYAMLGLRNGGTHLIDFLLTLVLISSTAASINLIIGILIKNIMTGIFVGIIVMIHFFMMTKLFINFDDLSIKAVKILNYVSYFNFGYEALVQNELVGRTIQDFAVDTGNGVLEYLGFKIDTLYQNLFILTFYFLFSLVIAFLSLKLGIREGR